MSGISSVLLYDSSDDDDDLPDKSYEYIIESMEQQFHQLVDDYILSDDGEPNKKYPRTKKTSGEKGPVVYKDVDGTTQVLPSIASTWFKIYVASPDIDSSTFQKTFCNRFRMPYAQFLELVEKCKSSDLFDRWRGADATGKDPVPLELLVLTALRYLGRGWTFDDLSESTGISCEVICAFFHKFVEFGSTVLFDEFVVAPSTTDDAARHSHEFEMAGLPGAIGSMDATHVLLEKVSYTSRQAHLGFKMNATARTYNLVVNHRRRILGTTSGHPARWNDKTVVRFDKIAYGLKEGTLLNDFVFELYDYDSNGHVIKVKYKGPWLVTDNGYLRWSTTIPPFKATTSRKEIRFSEWLECIRKDVECTFGILKGRWRILKAGIRVHGLDTADCIWKTCCSLHNYLLEIDGLDEKWESGVRSDWETHLGLHDDDDIQHRRPLQRLNNPALARTYDSSGLGVGTDRMHTKESTNNDILENETFLSETNENEYVYVRKMSFDQFRTKLVTHFDIAYRRREIKWPERNRLKQKS